MPGRIAWACAAGKWHDSRAMQLDDTAESSPQKHPGSFQVYTVTPAIDRAIKALVPSGRRREILALFGNRVSWSAIRHWRKGRAKPPQWVVDQLQQRYAAPIMEIEPAAPNGAKLLAWLEAHGRLKKKPAG